MTPKQTSQSPALQLVLHVWKHEGGATPVSWTRVNNAMYAALQLAITGGLQFDLADFAIIYRECNASYWIRPEGHYAAAVSVQNYSACESFENWRARQPIRADNVEGDGWLHVSRIRRQRERLAVGFTFEYAGYRPKVTSFRDGKVIACAYETHYQTWESLRNRVMQAAREIRRLRKPGGPVDQATVDALCDAIDEMTKYETAMPRRGALKRRFALSQKDIVRDRSDRKWKERIATELAAKWTIEQCGAVRSELGIRSFNDLLRTPRRKVERALEKLGLEETP